MNSFLVKRCWFLIISILLMGCNNQNSQLTPAPSSTSEQTATVIPTQTKLTPTQVPTKTSTPTLTPLPPYSTKQVLLGYTINGFHSPYEIFFSDPSLTHSRLVLYTDGQLIIEGTPYQQKTLSVEEINQLLSKLETLGFFTIESNQQHDPTDQLYNFGGQYESVGVTDGQNICVSVNADKARQLCVYEPYMQFLVPKMTNILKFMDEYQPKGMSLYYPDRILLWVQAGRNSDDNELPQDAIPWIETSLSLETPRGKVIYADGETAKELYALYGDKGYVCSGPQKLETTRRGRITNQERGPECRGSAGTRVRALQGL